MKKKISSITKNHKGKRNIHIFFDGHKCSLKRLRSLLSYF